MRLICACVPHDVGHHGVYVGPAAPAALRRLPLLGPRVAAAAHEHLQLPLQIGLLLGPAGPGRHGADQPEVTGVLGGGDSIEKQLACVLARKIALVSACHSFTPLWKIRLM